MGHTAVAAAWLCGVVEVRPLTEPRVRCAAGERCVLGLGPKRLLWAMLALTSGESWCRMVMELV